MADSFGLKPVINPVRKVAAKEPPMVTRRFPHQGIPGGLFLCSKENNHQVLGMSCRLQPKAGIEQEGIVGAKDDQLPRFRWKLASKG
jgi:hypothetical protein